MRETRVKFVAFATPEQLEKLQSLTTEGTQARYEQARKALLRKKTPKTQAQAYRNLREIADFGGIN